MNAIGYAHFELNGGWRKVLRWTIGFAVLAIVGIIQGLNSSGSSEGESVALAGHLRYRVAKRTGTGSCSRCHAGP